MRDRYLRTEQVGERYNIRRQTLYEWQEKRAIEYRVRVNIEEEYEEEIDCEKGAVGVDFNHSTIDLAATNDQGQLKDTKTINCHSLTSSKKEKREWKIGNVAKEVERMGTIGSAERCSCPANDGVAGGKTPILGSGPPTTGVKRTQQKPEPEPKLKLGLGAYKLAWSEREAINGSNRTRFLTACYGS